MDIEEAEEVVDDGSGSEIDLSTEDDLVLDEGSGSDITLDSGDSGINLGAPSDSGLALDDIPLDIGGSAILSSLSLSGDSDPEISLVGGESQVEEEGSAALQTDDDFQLTPLSEGAKEAEGDSSSQVIALDADIEELGESAAGQFEDVDLTEEADDAVVLTEDLSEGAAEQIDMGYAPAPAAAAAADEMQYGWVGMLLLCAASTFLLLCGVMMLDMIRNIWTWNESFGVSSSLLDALLGMFGLQ